MRKFFSLLLVALLASSVPSCFTNAETIVGGKRMATKQYNMPAFSGVSVRGSGDVVYTQKAGKPGVTIEVNENLVPYLDIKVEGGKLNIGFKKGISTHNVKLRATVSSERMEEVNIAGSGSFKAAGTLNTDDFQVSIAGSGDVDLREVVSRGNVSLRIAGSGEVEANRMKADKIETKVAGSGDVEIGGIDAKEVAVSVAGSGDVKLSGQTRDAYYKISGSGDIEAHNLRAENAEAHVSGSGDITCHATQSFKASRAGSGDIHYKGNPQKLDIGKGKGIHKMN